MISWSLIKFWHLCKCSALPGILSSTNRIGLPFLYSRASCIPHIFLIFLRALMTASRLIRMEARDGCSFNEIRSGQLLIGRHGIQNRLNVGPLGSAAANLAYAYRPRFSSSTTCISPLKERLHASTWRGSWVLRLESFSHYTDKRQDTN